MDAELEFPVMGTTAHVLVVATTDDAARAGAERARERLFELEARWSRFLPTSEISVINRAGGAPVIVSAETRALVARAVEGWRRTAGRFDPTVLDSLVALGYDRDFDAIDRAAPAPVTTIPAPGGAGIVVDRLVGAVRLPVGVHLDPGGIGKGLAADLVVEELLGAGLDGACVNVGGDLRVEGRPPGDAPAWTVDLEHPITGASVVPLRLAGGAVASTWRTRRVWGPTGEHHHLVDPATGASACSGLAGTAVIAARAWWAEVLAKAAFLEGARGGAALLHAQGVSGFLFEDDGRVHGAGAAESFAA